MAHSTDFDYLYKYLVIGDTAVGKTCLVEQFAEAEFIEPYICTIGVDSKLRSST